MTDNIAAPISPERVIELLKKLPPRTGLPFTNDEHFRIAWVLRSILIDCEIYEVHNIGLTLAKLGL